MLSLISDNGLSIIQYHLPSLVDEGHGLRNFTLYFWIFLVKVFKDPYLLYPLMDFTTCITSAVVR